MDAAVNDGQKKVHADTLAPFRAASSPAAGTGVLLDNVRARTPVPRQTKTPNSHSSPGPSCF